MRVPSIPSDVQAQTDSQVSTSFSHATLDDAALAAAFVQADLNALALRLAEGQIRIRTAADGMIAADGAQLYCAECLSRWAYDGDPSHHDICIVGNIIKLAAKLGELRAAAGPEPDFSAAKPQLPSLGPLCGHHRNGMYCSDERGHTDAHSVRIDGENHFWRNGADTSCQHCGPHCARGAAHNARVEDGVFFRPYMGLTARGRASLFAARRAAWDLELACAESVDKPAAPDRHIEYFAPPIGRGVEALYDPAPFRVARRVTHEEAAHDGGRQ